MEYLKPGDEYRKCPQWHDVLFRFEDKPDQKTNAEWMGYCEICKEEFFYDDCSEGSRNGT